LYFDLALFVAEDIENTAPKYAALGAKLNIFDTCFSGGAHYFGAGLTTLPAPAATFARHCRIALAFAAGLAITVTVTDFAFTLISLLAARRVLLDICCLAVAAARVLAMVEVKELFKTQGKRVVVVDGFGEAARQAIAQ
jgi:hypothetical protein